MEDSEKNKRDRLFSHSYLCRRRHKVARIAEQNWKFCSRFLRRKAPAEWRSAMKEKLKQILARFVFSLYHKKILKNRISVNSIEETIEHLVKSEDSLVRFGDGEIKLIAGKEIPWRED